jgi:(2S)-methylsuccinyl-CoA dehydrogenase
MLNKTNNTKNSISNKYSNIIKGLENIFEKIKKELVKKKELSQDNFKVWEEKNQHLVHGFAWIATYIEALRQINNWGIELANKNKLNEFEQLILDISFIEYIRQILNGIPMSQTEFIKITDFESINKNDELKISENFNFSSVSELKERLVKIAINNDNIITLENTGLETEYEQIREQFQKFNSLNVYNNANKWHLEDKLIPQKIIDDLASLGVFGLTIPEKYGGLGLNKLAMCVVSEELARGYIGVGSLATRTEIASELILNDGTETQKDFWLPKISKGETIPAACFTEPDSGSDLGSITTKAIKDDGKFLISGNKTWITHASRSNLLIILARTNPDILLKHKGLSIFLVPKTQGKEDEFFPNKSISGTEIKVLGYRGMKEFELRLDNLEVEKISLLGENENSGFSQLMKTFESARIQTAARAVGVAQNALDLAISYASNRKQFNKSIINFERVYNKIAMMIIEIALGRQLTYFAAKNKDLGFRCDLEAGMAKLLCARIAWSCADNSLQIHGGNGYALEYDISRILCDARVLSIFEGSAEIQAQIISNRILGRGPN